MQIAEETPPGSQGTFRLASRAGSDHAILILRGTKPKLITGYSFLTELFSGTGTQLKCVVSYVKDSTVICLTGLVSLSGLELGRQTSEEDLAIRLWLLETAILASHNSRFCFCLPDVTQVKPTPRSVNNSLTRSTDSTDCKVVLWVTREEGHDSYALHHKAGLVGKALVPSLELSKLLREKFTGRRVEDCDADEQTIEPARQPNRRLRFLCRYHRAFKKWVPIKPSKKAVSSEDLVRSVSS